MTQHKAMDQRLAMLRDIRYHRAAGSRWDSDESDREDMDTAPTLPMFHYTIREMLEAGAGLRAEALARARTEARAQSEAMEQEWRELARPEKAAQMRAMADLLKQQYDHMIKMMQLDQINWMIARQQASFDTDWEKVIQKFLSKLAPVLSLWGILPRAEKHHYPWVVELQGEAQQLFHWQTWVGEGFAAALASGVAEHGVDPFHICQGHRTYQVFAHGATLLVGVQPVHTITKFLEHAADRAVQQGMICLSSKPAPAIFTGGHYKLCQLEYYYALENSDSAGKCQRKAVHQCLRKHCLPLSRVQDCKRTILWWCQQCQDFTTMATTPTVLPAWADKAMWYRRFPDQPPQDIGAWCSPSHADPLLPLPMTWYDWSRYVKQLQRRKAGGMDGITYELVRDAPMVLQRVIFDGVNAMLEGQRLPADWKGGIVRLLTKREPASQIENMRPVTLLQVTYKLFTSVVSDRVSYAMERGGTLED
eukprot:561786-Rhodomonas_salina.1